MSFCFVFTTKSVVKLAWLTWRGGFYSANIVVVLDLVLLLGDTGMLVVSEEKSFMVMASTAVDKDGWLQAIRLCMRDLSLKAEAREKICAGQVRG